MPPRVFLFEDESMNRWSDPGKPEEGAVWSDYVAYGLVLVLGIAAVIAVLL